MIPIIKHFRLLIQIPYTNQPLWLISQFDVMLLMALKIVDIKFLPMIYRTIRSGSRWNVAFATNDVRQGTFGVQCTESTGSIRTTPPSNRQAAEALELRSDFTKSQCLDITNQIMYA